MKHSSCIFLVFIIVFAFLVKTSFQRTYVFHKRKEGEIENPRRGLVSHDAGIGGSIGNIPVGGKNNLKRRRRRKRRRRDDDEDGNLEDDDFSTKRRRRRRRDDDYKPEKKKRRRRRRRDDDDDDEDDDLNEEEDIVAMVVDDDTNIVSDDDDKTELKDDDVKDVEAAVESVSSGLIVLYVIVGLVAVVGICCFGCLFFFSTYYVCRGYYRKSDEKMYDVKYYKSLTTKQRQMMRLGKSYGKNNVEVPYSGFQNV